MKSITALFATPILVLVVAIAGHRQYGDQNYPQQASYSLVAAAAAQQPGPLPNPDPPPAPIPPKVDTTPSVEPEPQIFTITTDEARFPATLETIYGETVRCVRFKTGNVPSFSVNGAGDRPVKWVTLPPSKNFRQHDVDGRIGHEATFGSPIAVNTAIFASVASEDGADSYSDVILVIAEDGITPTPTPPGPTPPGPTPPGPTPGPTPDGTAPINKPGLYVLIVFETEKIQDLTEDQQTIIGSTKLRAFLNSNCATAEDKKPAYKIMDEGQILGDDSVLAVWKTAAELKPELGARIIISNGKTGTIDKLPAGVDETIALVTKYKLQ